MFKSEDPNMLCLTDYNCHFALAGAVSGETN